MKKIFTLSILAFSIFLMSCSGNEETDNAQIETDISPVIPKANGTVTDVLVSDNQVVKEGNLLVKLDDAAYKIAARQAEVAVAIAKENVALARSNKGTVATSVNAVSANSRAVEANLASARAGVEAAKVRVNIASKNFERFKFGRNFPARRGGQSQRNLRCRYCDGTHLGTRFGRIFDR
jgi:membrane fusion protein, multidrug efflux system